MLVYVDYVWPWQSECSQAECRLESVSFDSSCLLLHQLLFIVAHFQVPLLKGPATKEMQGIVSLYCNSLNCNSLNCNSLNFGNIQQRHCFNSVFISDKDMSISYMCDV